MLKTEHTDFPGLWECLDASRREIVQLCGEKGRALFLFLMKSATIMPGRDDMAVFSKLRLCDVASQLGWSPDTVKRYVAVFRALSLVQHYHDHRREVTLHISLGPYFPLTNLAALDELISKRQKQQQLALKVKTRYILRFGDPTRTHSDETHAKLAELKAILDNEHLEPLKRQRLQIKIADLLIQFAGKTEIRVGDLNIVLEDTNQERQQLGAEKQGDSNRREGDFQQKNASRFPLQNELQGDSNGTMGDSEHLPTLSLSQLPMHLGDSNRREGDFQQMDASRFPLQNGLQGDSNGTMGDSEHLLTLSLSQLPMHLGDSNNREGDLNGATPLTLDSSEAPQGEENQREGDLVPSSISTSSALPLAQVSPLGDSNHIQGEENQTPQRSASTMGDSGSLIEQKSGDSNVDGSNPYTYNVNFILNNNLRDTKNVIRMPLAKFLVERFEENEFENGYPTFSKYLKAFKLYTPEVIGRAYLATLFLLHHKNWQVGSRGAIFTNQCKILSGQMPIAHYTLDDVEVWLQAWGNLPYQELIRAIAAPLPRPQSSEPAALITAPQKASSGSRSGSFGAPPARRKGRTYGLQFTGRASGRYHTGPALPPEDFENAAKEKHT